MTVDKIESILSTAGVRAFDVIHLAGHGETIDVGEVPAAVAWLQPKLVVLNACDSAVLAAEICKQAPLIVVAGWSGPVDSKDCIHWTKVLYNQLKTPPSNWGAAVRQAEALRGAGGGCL